MPIHPLESREDYDAAVGSDRPAIVFKHSPACGTSFMALRVVSAFAERHPAVPVFLVDVINQRGLSDGIADGLGIRHESPQAIVTQAGKAVWSASHGSINANALAERIASAAAATATTPGA